MIKSILTAAAAIAASLTAANATVYQHELNSPGGYANAGDITYWNTEFDNVNDTFTFNMTVNTNTSNLPNGQMMNNGWMVINDGPSPNGNIHDTAIMYFDFLGGDVYVYDYAQYGNQNWANAEHIITYNDVLDYNFDGQNITLGLEDLDVSFVNNYYADISWDGISFDDTIGVWSHWHYVDNFTTTNNADASTNSITSWNANTSQWSFYETRNNTNVTTGPSTPVNEPVGMALLGLMGIAFVATRRRRS